MPTSFTDAPAALPHLWNTFFLSGKVVGQNPPATMREAYNQVVAIQLRQMRKGVQAINEDAQQLLDLDGPRPPSVRGKSADQVCRLTLQWGHVLSWVRGAAVVGGNQ